MVDIGGIGSLLPPDPWVLILGGVTREGNRRARRTASAALESGISVVWFDGFEESYESREGERVPLNQHRSAVGVPITIIGYAEHERGHWLNRMFNPLAGLERPLPTGGLSRTILTKVLRRISLIFRGVIGWRLVKPDIEELARTAPAPIQIVFGDDFALTQAWYAARIWTRVPAAMELIES